MDLLRVQELPDDVGGFQGASELPMQSLKVGCETVDLLRIQELPNDVGGLQGAAVGYLCKA